MEMKIDEIAREYALRCHREAKQMYGDKPYEFHLFMVVDFANRFLHLIPETERAHVIAGCWVHDVIEDCTQSYNDVKKATNQTVAELAFALTNEKGRNRKERANDRYYTGIRETPHAAFIKACDRLANISHSKSGSHRMFGVYREEHPHFRSKLYDEKYDEMFRLMDELVTE
jgi:(p)ppGpp synthase/HD superfamily hydrolase